jgi:phenylacetate-CoA ligase
MTPEDRRQGFLNPRLETMHPEEREAYLTSKLKDLLKIAYKKSRPYQGKFKALGAHPEDFHSLKDLETIPLTHRQELVSLQRKDPPFGGFLTVPREKLRRIYISPGLIFGPGEWIYKDTRWAEALFACGFRKGDLAINTFNYQLWPFAFVLDESLQQIGCTAIPAGSGNTQMQIRIINTLKVTAFAGTPSFLMDISEQAGDMGAQSAHEFPIQVGFVSAEMLPETLRQRLEVRLGMIIRQGYGTVDVGCLGYECPNKSGLHIPADVIVELVDPETGHSVPSGTPGEIVATHFNTIFPLIRFATGDLSIMNSEPCPCGRTAPRLLKILGRIDQATKVQGLFIHPWQIDEVASKFPQIAQYQLVITRKDHRDEITFFVELKEDTSDPSGVKRQIEIILKEILNHEGRSEILPRGTLPEWHKKIEDRRVWE